MSETPEAVRLARKARRLSEGIISGTLNGWPTSNDEQLLSETLRKLAGHVGPEAAEALAEQLDDERSAEIAAETYGREHPDTLEWVEWDENIWEERNSRAQMNA